jgi:hypothetical protein
MTKSLAKIPLKNEGPDVKGLVANKIFKEDIK